jgi:hemoglobin-like flavoprotein
VAEDPGPIEREPAAALNASLEAIADQGIDIVPRFFACFYAEFPAQRERFCNRKSSEGLMVNEMIAMILAAANREPWLDMMMRAQVNTHHSHGDISQEQYQRSLSILVDVLRNAAGNTWNDRAEQAWRSQAAVLVSAVARYA